MEKTPSEVGQASALRSIIATATGFIVRWAVTKIPQLSTVEPQLQEFLADIVGIVVAAIVKFFHSRSTATTVRVI